MLRKENVREVSAEVDGDVELLTSIWRFLWTVETEFSWLFPRTFGSFLFLFLNVLGSKINQRDRPPNSFFVS